MKTVKLPSGSELAITLSPFSDSRALYQALLEEGKLVDISGGADMFAVMKEVFCISFSSKKIEACVWKCMERATYNKLKIGEDTFEPEEAREDYFSVLYEVATENIRPFTKSLSAQLKAIKGQMEAALESK